jgi:hypothetical protein
MADIKAIKDQIWYIKRDIQNEEKKRDEWATTVSCLRLAESLQCTDLSADFWN